MAELNLIMSAMDAEKNKSAWYTPRNSQGEPYGDPPFRIHFLSRKSDEWRAMEKAWQAEALDLIANGRKMTAADQDRFHNHLVKCHMAITLGWENLEQDGQAVPCTQAWMKQIYSHPEFFDGMVAWTNNNFSYSNEPEPTILEDAEKKLLNGSSGEPVGVSTSA